MVQRGVCVDWHTLGPAVIGAAGEMWTGYPQFVRPETGATASDSDVIPVLPSTTAETGSPSIRKNEPCGRRHGVALLSDPALRCAVDLDLSLAVHRRIQRQHHPDRRASVPANLWPVHLEDEVGVAVGHPR